MSITLLDSQKAILKAARETYGARNQLAVAAEECNELAIAVLKFMRYHDEKKGIEETYKNVLEERADVEIVLNHIDSLYGFTEDQIVQAMEGKIKRLKRWLNKTDDFAYTMVDREVGNTDSCDSSCFYYNHPEEAFEKEVCKNCEKCKNHGE